LLSRTLRAQWTLLLPSRIQMMRTTKRAVDSRGKDSTKTYVTSLLITPGTSPALIKSLFPSTITVDAVRILPPSGPVTLERKSVSAIVTTAKDTPANDIDTAVNGLQNRYLGWGFYLSLSRHLSSAALNAGMPVSAGTVSATSSLPFGARPIPTGPGGGLSRAPPRAHTAVVSLHRRLTRQLDLAITVEGASCPGQSQPTFRS
jgi:U2-associated protein SR140